MCRARRTPHVSGMVLGHTYYLARWGRCHGAHAGDAELCEVLRSTWQRLGGDEEPTLVDGVSAWVEPNGHVRICLVRAATPQMIGDDELARWLAPHLVPPAPHAA